MRLRDRWSGAGAEFAARLRKTARPRRSAGRVVAGLVVACGLAALGAVPRAADPEFPAQPLAGRVLFENKYCIRCHSIAGAGGDIGPDLAEAEFSGSFLDLGAILWNHVPDMAAEYEALDIAWPTFSDHEIRDLVSFLYYLRYLGTPGDDRRGRVVFQVKGCIHCHSVVQGDGGKVGPPLDRLKLYASPIFVIQAVWNHGPQMLEQMRRMEVLQPRITGQEISDVAAYIRSMSGDAVHEETYLSPGDPNAGVRVYSEKGCPRCHAIHGQGGEIGPALDKVDLYQSVAGIAGLMWNHGASMLSVMEEEHLSWPTFEGSEMADLIAYLYFVPFLDPSGDSRKGAELFEERGCRSCHALSGQGGTAAHDLASSPALGSDVAILRAMINSGAKMWDVALSRGMTWQPLTGRDLRDIRAYLESSRKPTDR